MGSIDLTSFLPNRNRDKTIDTLLKNLFNRHLSKSDVVTLFGYVGDSLELNPGEVQIAEENLERKLNQLIPFIYAEHASEKRVYSWPDMINALESLGIKKENLKTWLKSASYNFVPPIDIDKFCNFQEYYWIGSWVAKFPNSSFESIGIPSVANYIIPKFSSWDNSAIEEEYYVSQRGKIVSGVPVSNQPGIDGWTDWEYTNLWIHRDDAIAFIQSSPMQIGYEDLVQATRPIIEYKNGLSLNIFKDSTGVPSKSGIPIGQEKRFKNQLPLFDLFLNDGTHAGLASSIFYYKESQSSTIDSVIGRRLVVDENNDFIFGHSLVAEDGQLYFYKKFNDSSYEYNTIWTKGPDVEIQYKKFDTSGTLIDQDKFKNFKNYFWVGVDKTPQPSYNVSGLPEYVTIAKGGNSDWSKYNYWEHVSKLRRSELKFYVQAEKPIIEFNSILESELLGQKTKFQELPRFKHYLETDNGYEEIVSSYEETISSYDSNLNDAYLNRVMFARVSDLPEITQTVLKTNSEFQFTSFSYNDETFVQGLNVGAYYPSKDGIIYGYKARNINVGVNNVVINNTKDEIIKCANFEGLPTQGIISKSYVTVDNNKIFYWNGNSYIETIPQVITFTNTGSRVDTDGTTIYKFNVVGSVNGSLGVAETKGVFNLGGVSFHLATGTFNVGDFSAIEVLSYVFNKKKLYVKVGENYRTLESSTKIYTETESSYRVDASPENNDGEWVTPSQLEWNVKNETKTEIKQGDIYYHLISIIEAQPGLIGSSSGNNNFRLLSHDLGLGGTIKQFDGNFSLLASMLMQEGVTINSLIDFLHTSYQGLSVSIKQFVENVIPDMISNGEFSPPSTGDSIDSQIVEKFKSFYSGSSVITEDSESVVDDVVSSPFYDSTSSIYNMVVTLPYLGLAPRVQPKKIFDYSLNMQMLRHHDGHQSALQTFSIDLAKKIVVKSFKRAPGQESQGFISGFGFPEKPYKCQFWFKTTTAQLFFYDVVSDSKELPEDSVIGTYSYDRDLNEIWVKDLSGWVNLGSAESSTSLPWKEVNFSLIAQNLELAIETELYENCPPVSSPINTTTYESSSLYHGFMKSELEKFGVKYGATDVYASAYDSSNPFTWNYSGAFGNDIALSTWQSVYFYMYGTVRPDLHPWISSGYATEALFLTDAIADGLLPAGTVKFTSDMWPSVSEFVRSKLTRTTKLSVDVSTGKLISPFTAGHNESILSDVPSTLNQPFPYGSNGPVEMFWKKTPDYLHAKQKTFFKINPLDYLNKTWGYKHVSTNGYVFNVAKGRKLNPSDFRLHGEELASLAKLSWINATSLSTPIEAFSYTFKCVSRNDGIFKVSVSSDSIASILDLPRFVSLNSGGDVRITDLHYTDQFVDVLIKPTNRGFYWGDTYTVSVGVDGTVSCSVTPQTLMKFEGLNQVYVQYGRMFGEDSQISINRALLQNWDVKLGYRFGGMINTDSLKITSNSEVIDESAYSVYVKENKKYDHSWINSLRVQLVQKGSTTYESGYNIPSKNSAGVPGEDWIFRVDNYNVKNPVISWYEYDLDGDKHSFVAMNGARTTYEWTRYKTKKNVRSYATPFLVTGIQNLVNFVFGYADYLADEGWVFNDDFDPIIDPETGRQSGYQVLVEKFINQQFSNADAGSTYVFNPFYRKLWYITDHGVVSGLQDGIGLEQDSNSAVLDINGKTISKKNIRVFRQDDITEFVFDRPMYTMHVMVSEYEHVVLFNNYSVDTLLIYDSFLGQRTNRLFFEGEKQLVFTGRVDFGGHYLLGDKMKKNIESSIKEIGSLYDTSARKSESVNRARAILGFSDKDYFDQRGMTKSSQFRFWQGMLPNKGTNFAIDAYINSASYENAKVDEYWAYKIAEYGDDSKINRIEMMLQPEDCLGETTYYRFLEDGETGETTGSTVVIRPGDEERWKSYSDLNMISSFGATKIAETFILPTHVGQIITIKYQGKPVRADKFEIHDPSFVESSDSYDFVAYDESPFNDIIKQVYFEAGEYENGSFTSPSFERINQSTIRILSDRIIGRTLKVVSYGPNEKKFSPMSIYDKITNTLVDGNIIWWDPARGLHNPRAAATIDIDGSKDPAVYTDSLNTREVNALKPWGAEQVGRVWWNTKNLYWTPYSDDKIFDSIVERVNRWGSVSEASTIEVYEWIKSSTPPSEASTGEGLNGEPARVEHVVRNRTWWQRPVAWRYSENPVETSRSFLEYQPDVIKLVEGKAILSSLNFADLSIKVGTKIAAASYNSSVRDDSSLIDIQGTAIVTSLPKVIVGTLTDPTGSISGCEITVTEKDLAYRDKYLGVYDVAVSGSEITMSFSGTGETQTIEYKSTANTSQYHFDKFGITIVTNAIITNASFVLRSYVTVNETIEFSSDTLAGWIAWNDPSTNPNAGATPPLNNYEPFAGKWVKVGSKLHLVKDDIKNRMADKWTWFDSVDYTPYKSTWTDWNVLQDEFVEAKYGVDPMNLSFQNITATQLKSRAQVFINELKTDKWTVIGETPTIVINQALSEGDVVRVKVFAYTPSKKELAFDPSVKDDDPFVLVQYKKNYPYVLEVLRDNNGGLNVKNYYYWVKNKTVPAENKKVSIKMAADLLRVHEGIYAIPQGMKEYDQINSIDNRYHTLVMINLSSAIRSENRCFLRITENSSLRDRDQNITMKPIHEEWKLIRIGQLDRIPKALWDKVTETLTAADSLDNDLPFSSYELYDERNNTKVRYGLEAGKILTDSASAIANVKYTILNTQLDKYENGETVPDYISYDGFDSSKIDEYFASKESIRKFMSDLWRFANASQINEIFFAVLQDAIAKNLELSGLFKTSFISLSDIRTVSISG